jgi:transcriptional regulator with XRE-family HTH domain
MISIRQILGDNLRNYRAVLGLSQARLAEKAGITTQYEGMIEGGKKFPSPDTIDSIARALQIEPSELFAGKNNSRAVVRHMQIESLREIKSMVDDYLDHKIFSVSGKTDIN